MSVELEPSELGFRRPFDNEVSQVLRIKNPNQDPLAFKVKTTAPKQYCVRPNSGKIEPGETVDVSVVLQPMKQDPAPEVKCKDKFLVQSIVVPNNQETPPWSDLERNFKSSIIERKIRVTYLSADGSSSKQVNGIDDTIDDSVSSPPPSHTSHTGSSTVVENTPSSSRAPASSSESTSLKSAAVPSLEFSKDELKSQLDEANATIARLRREAEEGLRRRIPSKEQVTTTLAPQTLQQTGQTGVPVPTVALISLFVFLLTYLLF